MSIDYSAVVAELRARAAALTDCADIMQSFIGPSDSARPAVATTSTPIAVVAKRGYVKKQPAATGAVPAAPASEPISLAELIRRATLEHAFTSIELVAHIERLRPDALRASIATTISQLLNAGQLRKSGQNASGAPYVLRVINGSIHYPPELADHKTVA